MFSSSVSRTLPAPDALCVYVCVSESVCVCVHPQLTDSGRSCHFQIRRCMFGLSCFCLLRQPSSSAWRSVNIGAAGNFSIVFPSLFLRWHSKSRSGCLDFSVAACRSRVLTSGFAVEEGGMINSCKGRTVCTAASDLHLLFHVGDFF